MLHGFSFRVKLEPSAVPQNLADPLVCGLSLMDLPFASRVMDDRLLRGLVDV